MSISLDRIIKTFGSHLVVDRISLELANGEFFVLLGASGSGKSTVLRLIAGLVSPDSGRIRLHGSDVTELAPQRRGTGFVFQNYSIFRHMSVAENVEFGLRIRKIPKDERTRKREELLDLVGLAGLDRRYANQLSGGQLQRVALARALAYEPGVLLLDEPFGALDSKIRTQLRRSFKEIQQRLRVTTILVTHDQEEAFELADRIGVIEKGRLLETGCPESLYARPKSLFVATFLGAGTVLVGKANAGYAHFGSLSLPIPSETPHEDGARAQVLFRPEQVALTADKPDDGMPVIGRGKILEQTFSGPIRRVRLQLQHIPGTRRSHLDCRSAKRDFWWTPLFPPRSFCNATNCGWDSVPGTFWINLIRTCWSMSEIRRNPKRVWRKSENCRNAWTLQPRYSELPKIKRLPNPWRSCFSRKKRLMPFPKLICKSVPAIRQTT